MRKIMPYKHIIVSAVAALVALLAANAAAEVPDTNSYWKNLVGAEKLAKRHLDEAGQSCRGRSGGEAEAALKKWKSSLQTLKYPGSDFNPCSGSGTLLAGGISINASNGRPLKLTERGDLHTEWDFRNRTVKLWYGGDLIFLSIKPISATVLKASLASFGSQHQSAPPADMSEVQVVSGLEAIWHSARDLYPKHSLYDVARQVITGKDEGRELLRDFIRCGKSICD